MSRIDEVLSFGGRVGRNALAVRLLVGAVLALQPGSSAEAQGIDFTVVVHTNNPASTVTLTEVGEFFRKAVGEWQEGTPVVPVDLQSSSPVRENFSQAVHGRPGAAMDAFWRRQVFSGRGSPPVVLDSEASVLAYLSANPNAIGYVSRGTPLPAGVKELQIVTPRPSAVYTAGAVDELPVGTARPRLEYPRDLEVRGVEGTVLLEFTIDERGRVDPSTVNVVEASNPGFVRPARAMIEQSRFRPGRVAGDPVSVVVQQTVRFNLSNF